MIDISQLETITFDVKLTDGRILNIRKPNKELFNNTFKMIKLIEANEEDDKILDVIYSFLTKIFNRNANDIKVTQKELETELDVVNAMIIVRAYSSFITEAMTQINF